MTTNQGDRNKVNIQGEAAFKALIGDRTVAYQVAFAKAFNSVTAGLLVSQFAYWSFRTQDLDGWFYKTQAEIFDELGLTRYEQETARKALKRSGVLQEKVKGVPSKLYFRIDITKLLEAVGSYQTKGNNSPGPTGEPQSELASTEEITAQDVGNQHPRMRDSNNLGWGIPTDKDDGFHPTIAETTQRLPPETTRHNFEISNGKFASDKGSTDAVGESPRHSEPTAIGQLLPQAQNRLNISNRGRPPKANPAIQDYMIQFSLEFHDEEHTKSNVTRAMRIFRASGLGQEAFIQQAFEARSITKQQPNIRKDASSYNGYFAGKNKMPYFFRVLEDIIGTNPHPYTPSLGLDDAPAEVPPLALPQNHQATMEVVSVDPEPETAQPEVPISELDILWQKVLVELSIKMSKPNFATWLRETRLLQLEGGRAVVASPTKFQSDHLSLRFRKLIDKSITVIAGVQVSTDYAILSDISIS